MPHADATAFRAQISKAEAYAQVIESLGALTSDSRFWPTNTANAASLLWHLYHSLPAPASSVNWAGFYVAAANANTNTNTSRNDASLKKVGVAKGELLLLLGPFMGKVACQTITVGKGVCGAAAERGQTVLVDDVELFPGHIACDGESRSEIVVPVMVAGKCVAVIDIDCAEIKGFDQEDQKGLEAVAKLLADACDW